MLNVNAFDTRRTALLMMHYQADVFAVLLGKERLELIDRANVRIQVRKSTGRPVIFANFVLGERYEMVNPDMAMRRKA